MRPSRLLAIFLLLLLGSGTVSSASASEASQPCSPVILLDDLTESALHLSQEEGKINPSSNAEGAALKLEAAGKVVPHILNYRASQAAAGAFLGTPTHCLAHQEEALRCQIQLRLVTALIQLADNLHRQGPEEEARTKEALEELTLLIGKAQAQWLVERLLSWAKKNDSSAETAISSASITSTSSLTSTSTFSWLEEERNRNLLTEKAIENDRRNNTLKARLAAFNIKPSPTEKTLTVVSYAPIIFASLAKLAQVGIEKANGGTRSQRLDEVVSLGLAIEERNTLLARLSSLALEAQQSGYAKKNLTLLQLGRDLQNWLSASGNTIKQAESTASVR